MYVDVWWYLTALYKFNVINAKDLAKAECEIRVHAQEIPQDEDEYWWQRAYKHDNH